MSEQERTPWISVRTPPVRAGWYEYRGAALHEANQFYWNGYQWGYWHCGVWWQVAEDWGDGFSDEWRGLTKRATSPC